MTNVIPRRAFSARWTPFPLLLNVANVQTLRVHVWEAATLAMPNAALQCRMKGFGELVWRNAAATATGRVRYRSSAQLRSPVMAKRGDGSLAGAYVYDVIEIACVTTRILGEGEVHLRWVTLGQVFLPTSLVIRTS